MPMRRMVFALALLLLPGAAGAEEVRVVSSGGFAEAYKELAPAFEKATGHTLVSVWGPSMGATANAVPQRLARGEPLDVAIMVGYALGKLVEEGRASDRVDLANSGIALAVREGAAVPDIGTADKLREVLLAARSVAYSDSASGVYIEREMFGKLGIEEQMRGKARMIAADPVGGVVARGEAEIGFQQRSELMAVKGITIVGLIPDGVQQNTVFSAGVLSGSAHKEAGRALIRFLSAPEAAAIIRHSGMEPIAAR